MMRGLVITSTTVVVAAMLCQSTGTDSRTRLVSSRLAPGPACAVRRPDAAPVLARDPHALFVHNLAARLGRGAAVRRVEVTSK
jgi:hypothetical protein